MDVVRLPKKFRDLCAAVRDGLEPDPKLMAAFREKLPHQAAAVEAETAAFRMEWETVLEKELFILPYLREWYYSNVPAEQMMLLAFSARQLGREAEAEEALTKEQAALLAENPQAGQRSPFYACAGHMLAYLATGVAPYDEELHYAPPEEPKTAAELQGMLTPKERGSRAGRQKLLNLCCLHGSPEDALTLYEELAAEMEAAGTVLTEMWHRYAIQRYLYLGAREEALRAAERWGASRLWAVAAPTQVRPVCFFRHPILHPFLTDSEKIKRLERAGFSAPKEV